MKWQILYKRILATSYIVICLLGLMWQLIEVSIEYFKYETSTGIRMLFPDDVTFPDISVCLRYTDILDFDELNKQTERTFSFTTDDKIVRRYQENLTLNEIFNFTPSVNQSLTSIVFRQKKSYKRYSCSKNECEKVFSISKYYYLEYMCYRFTSLEQVETSVPYSTIAVSPSSPGTIYKLTLNGLFNNVSYLKLALHSANLYPFLSLRTTPVTRRYFDSKTLTAKYNTFVSFQSQLVTQYLPQPYVTKCIDYKLIGLDSSAHCRELCVKNHTLNLFHKVPFSVILTAQDLSLHNSLYALSYNDVANESTSQVLLAIESMCENEICNLKDCNRATIVTHTTKEPGSLNGLVLRIILPYTPYIYVKHNASIQFVAFLTFILSTISTWTGLSILRMNPFTSFLTPGWVKQLTYQMKQKSRRRRRRRRGGRKEMKNITETKLSIDLFRLTETVHAHATRIKRLELIVLVKH